jgi:hypothetical protein
LTRIALDLQILPGWQEYFHKPQGMKLGMQLLVLL